MTESHPPAEPAPTGSPSSSLDAVIQVYKRDVDRTLLRETLALTPDRRIRRLADFLRVADELRRGVRDATRVQTSKPSWTC